MDLLAGIGCACAGLLAVLAAALLGVAYRLGLLYQLWHKVDPRSPRHGGELVAEVLKAHGVRFLFALAGGHIFLGIRLATAVFAADAVSRLSGRIGVAAVTAGPGVTNAVTAIKNAQMAESPVLLIGGAAASLQKGRGALQDIDQLSLFKTLCKACVSVRAVRDIIPALRKAIATAQSGTPGPVFVELPIDVLYPFHMVEKEIGGTKSGRGLRGSAVIQWYLQNYIRNLGAWVQRCVELVSRATKPLVLVGSQAMLPPTPAEELRAALEALGIPCYLGGAARGLLPPGSPLLLRQNRRDGGYRATHMASRCLSPPRHQVWVLYGDGSLGYSLMEFDTFVRHKTPVIALVGNDACWSQIAREQVALLGSNVACGLEYLDYHAVAEALGGKGFVVGRPDCERLDTVLRAAQDACRQGHPVLINALIGKTDFRDGSISV
ncbi:PREDICTED: acetolactate synthase-like protein [Aptenodytes forsteri]|uniref:acetolactate synthase-like protein n=1 Tax=Aptenodytes forsteri TaxID=9233 RepID=UPI0009058DE3|nr:PREDICTED: acetolactate synthase-like protein [Aptenodytes forsteri]